MPYLTCNQTVTASSGRRGSAGALMMACLAATLALVTVTPARARAQWVTTYEQFYLQAPHNWVFRNNYQGADRLFNAFDYGHAILYEKLWTKPGAPPSLLEEREYDVLTKQVLVRPPRVPLEEGAIEIRYVQLAPEAKQMFEWAHILHRQIYDVLADERLDEAGKDREVQRLIDYYKTRRDVAFSSMPKSMKLMQEQPYSLAFRQRYPKFNGLIWGYHWLQVGLYEPLMVGKTAAERQAGVRATVARFWQMLQDPPRTFPYQMPMTPAVAPTFAARYPEAAIIFDNLHSMHDVISDILANERVPRDRKRAEIQRAVARFRDDTSYVMTREGYLTMVRHMGLENMGGRSVGFLAALPSPTVTYGAVMSHDDRTGEMTGFRYGQATGGEHAGHDATASDTAASDPHAAHRQPSEARPPARGADTSDTSHAGHGATATDTAHRGMTHDSMSHDSMSSHDPRARLHMEQTMRLHQRMMADPVIRARIKADTALRRMMQAMHADMPPGPHGAMHGGDRATNDASSAAAARRRPARRATSAPTPRSRTAPKPPADPHAGHGASAMPRRPAPAPKKPATSDTTRHVHRP